jgi:hypothetical protein
MAARGKGEPTKSLQAAFLAAYEKCGNLTTAAKASKVHRSNHFRWLQSDEAYKAAFADAQQVAIETLEHELRIRATKGVAEPVIYQGRVCHEPVLDPEGRPIVDVVGDETIPRMKPLVIWRKSDVLLMFMLKGLAPEKYRDNAKVEHTGAGGGPVSFEVHFRKPE